MGKAAWRATGWTALAGLVVAGTLTAAYWTGRPKPSPVPASLAELTAREEPIDIDRVREHVRFLASLESRVCGYPGCAQAADYIARTLRAMGIESIERQSFTTVVPLVESAWLVLEDQAGRQRIPLWPLWPNLVRTCQTPPQGLTAPLVDGGSGSLGDLRGKRIRDAIVLVDWDSEREWMHVPEFGGVAVLFRPSDEASGYQARMKFLTVPADIPRFYVPPAHIARVEQAARTPGARATIHCRMRWRQTQAVNLIARLPADPQAIDPDEPQPPLILHAYYDSISVVPQRSPGAEQACGAAMLLELTRLLRALPLPRDVIVLFTSGHGQAFAGMKAFVRDYLLVPEGAAEPKLEPGLLVSLDLTTGTSQLGIFYKGYHYAQWDVHLRDWMKLLGLTMARVAGEAARAAGRDPAEAFVDGINPSTGTNWRTYFPFPLPFESEVVSLAGIPAVALATANDGRYRIDTPADRFEHVRFDRLAKQGHILRYLVKAMLAWRGPFVSKPLANFWVRLGGRVLYLHPKRSYIPDHPLSGAVVAIKNYTAANQQIGTRALPVTIADEQGRFVFDGLPNQVTVGPVRARYTVEAYKLDETTGRVCYANNLSEMRIKDYPNEVSLTKAETDVVAVVFPCVATTLFGLTEPREYLRLATVELFDAGTNSQPFRYGFSYPDQTLEAPLENCTTIFATPKTVLRLGLGAGPVGFRMVLLNADPKHPLGVGFDIQSLRTIPAMTLQGAYDMWYLDEWRLEAFRKYGVRNPRVEALHAEARRLLDEAAQALRQYDYPRYRVAAERGWANEMKAYPELLGTANDMVRGVIFYLALLLPFAYCMERLVVAAATIKGRVAGMMAVFAVGFAAISLVHPAFRFTLTPLLVLLAFVVMVLACTVSVLITQRFDSMLREIKVASLGQHESDVKRGAAALRAFDLGLSNIRRRPRRSFLTASTVVVVTFTLLSFTSLVPTLSVTTLTHISGEPRYPGLLIRNRAWWPLSRPRYESAKREYGRSAVVTGRAWFLGAVVGEISHIEVTRPGDPPKRFVANAVIGLEPQEPRVTGIDRVLLPGGRWFCQPDERSVIISTRMADLLGIGPADLPVTLEVYGLPLQVIALFDPAKMDDLHDIDGEPLTPVDFLEMSMKRQTEAPPREDEFERYFHLDSEATVIIPFRLALEIGAPIHSVAIRFDSFERVRPIAEDLARRSDQTMLAALPDRVMLYSSIGHTEFGGFGHIAIPVAIGCLIILSTMLGAVYERQREIFIHSSVGLSPVHISSLFLAEASVYAVLGAALGYLLGQAVAKVLLMTGALSGVSLNYSALSTVAVTLLTMAIVLASTIYPARQAFRAAMPDTGARGGAGPTEGEQFELDLPFLADETEMFGVHAYLYEFLDAYREATVGQLSVDDLRWTVVETDGRTTPALEFLAWLVPFDLGISQQVRITTVYRPDYRAHQFRLTARRATGDYQNWRRLNPFFLQVIRKQLLVWRILSPQDRSKYTAEGRRMFAEAVERTRTEHPGVAHG